MVMCRVPNLERTVLTRDESLYASAHLSADEALEPIVMDMLTIQSLFPLYNSPESIGIQQHFCNQLTMQWESDTRY